MYDVLEYLASDMSEAEIHRSNVRRSRQGVCRVPARQEVTLEGREQPWIGGKETSGAADAAQFDAHLPCATQLDAQALQAGPLNVARSHEAHGIAHPLLMIRSSAVDGVIARTQAHPQAAVGLLALQ